MDDAYLRRGKIGVVDSLSDEQEVGSSLFPVKETAHSLSPISGLALVTLVFMCHRMEEGMTDTQGSETGWAFFFVFFGAGASRAATFVFCKATHTKPSSFSLVSLRSFNLCVIEVIVGGRIGVDTTNSCFLLV